MGATKLIFGAGLWTKDQGANSADDVKPWVDALVESKHLVGEIDTSALYAQSEEYLGQLDLGSHFAIGTKLPGKLGPLATKETVIAQAKASLSKLGVDKVDILYMHAPDTRVPVEETISGFDALYKEGTIKRFGLSNYTPEQVEEVVRVCQDKGFVLPSVFQGSYSAVARLAEDKLLPILRKHGISFYAYSPIAGGFLTKTSQEFRDDSFRGRWEKSVFLGQCYHLMYNRSSALEALDKWHEIARAEGISAVEMAFRWVVHNSALDGSLGDGVVVGASTTEQWKNNLAAIQKGTLSSEATAKIDALWGPLKSESYYCNLDVVLEIMAGAAKQPAAEHPRKHRTPWPNFLNYLFCATTSSSLLHLSGTPSGAAEQHLKEAAKNLGFGIYSCMYPWVTEVVRKRGIDKFMSILQIVREEGVPHQRGLNWIFLKSRVYWDFRGRGKLTAEQREMADTETGKEILRQIDIYEQKL